MTPGSANTSPNEPASEPAHAHDPLPANRSDLLVYILVCGLIIACLAFFLQIKAVAPIVVTATQPSPLLPTERVLSVHDMETLKPLKGQVITAEGVVTHFGQSQSGNTRYLEFSEDRDAAIYFAFNARETNAKFPKDRLEKLVGKTIRVRGELGEYKGRLQIYVTRPNMVISAGDDG